jgi:acetyl esterase/lipase
VRKIFTLIAALTLLAGCTSQEVLNKLASDEGYSLSSNVAFDDASNLKLDVYAPDNAKNAPVVVFFYGARWEEGKKEMYKFVGQALAARGFVTVVPDYRLYPQTKFRGILSDNAKAVRWAHTYAGRYGGDPNKIVVMGHSAGAYNAAMLTLDPQYLKAVGGNASWLRGMIGLAGAYDFLPITDPDLRDLFGPPEHYDQSQPVLFVDGHNPPMLLMHGENDDNVPAKNSHSLATRIQKAGGPVETVFYPKMSHRWILETLATRLQPQADVMLYVNEFVKRVTNGSTPQRPPSGLQTTVPQP